jgi:hypothetical protein
MPKLGSCVKMVCTGFGCTKQSRRRTKATTSPYFHRFGVALQQGSWTTSVNKHPAMH